MKERHPTDHGFPSKHTNPHDHQIEWDLERGFPKSSAPINYPNDVPEFKHYREMKAMSVISTNSGG